MQDIGIFTEADGLTVDHTVVRVLVKMLDLPRKGVRQKNVIGIKKGDVFSPGFRDRPIPRTRTAMMLEAKVSDLVRQMFDSSSSFISRTIIRNNHLEISVSLVEHTFDCALTQE